MLKLLYNIKNKYLNTKNKNSKIKIKNFFPESLGQKCGCTLYIIKYGNSVPCLLQKTYLHKGKYASLPYSGMCRCLISRSTGGVWFEEYRQSHKSLRMENKITPGVMGWDLKGQDEAVHLAFMEVPVSESLLLAAYFICSTFLCKQALCVYSWCLCSHKMPHGFHLA